MTREEAIKRLEDTFEGWERWNPHNDSPASKLSEALDMAIAALREQPPWISVEDRLPDNKKHDWVLAQVVENNEYMHITKVMEYRQNKNDWFEETYGWISEHNGFFAVTHWMPLPEAPKEEV